MELLKEIVSKNDKKFVNLVLVFDDGQRVVIKNKFDNNRDYYCLDLHSKYVNEKEK